MNKLKNIRRRLIYIDMHIFLHGWQSVLKWLVLVKREFLELIIKNW